MPGDGAMRFIQESFAPIYADGGDAWLDENAPIRPAPHTRATLDAEAAVQRFGEHGGEGVVLRFAFFYGPDSAYTRDMVKYARRGLAASLGSPDDYVSSISHDDAASAVLAALELPAGTYNVADEEPVTRRAFFDALAEAFGFRPPRFAPAWVTKLSGSVGDTLARSQRISSRKLRQASHWRPAIPTVREGWRFVAAELRAAAPRPPSTRTSSP